MKGHILVRYAPSQKLGFGKQIKPLDSFSLTIGDTSVFFDRRASCTKKVGPMIFVGFELIYSDPECFIELQA